MDCQLLVTGRLMLINWWREPCPRIGSTSWLQGSVVSLATLNINSLNMCHCIGLPTPPTRYPLKEDLHDINTNAMTVY